MDSSNATENILNKLNLLDYFYITIDEDTYCNSLIILLTDPSNKINKDIQFNLFEYIANKLIARIDYQTGFDLDGRYFSYGPRHFNTTTDYFMKFILPYGYPAYLQHQETTIEKVYELIQEYSNSVFLN